MHFLKKWLAYGHRGMYDNETKKVINVCKLKIHVTGICTKYFSSGIVSAGGRRWGPPWATLADGQHFDDK